uniref:Transmembrane 4 L six family member 5 n=1 Tax=Podarcis muralis TaxID=64176 RepID=A0A670KK70_PODMU
MCTGKCARLVGLSLVTAGLACIVANILLMFPNMQRDWTPQNITTQVWLMGGLVGGGLMVSAQGWWVGLDDPRGPTGPPSLSPPPQMLRSVFCSIFGGLGGFYCLVVSSTALAEGPWCEAKDGTWGSPFKDLSESYLGNRTLWEECLNPPNVVMWHVVLFAILLGLGLVELALCGLQVVNGLVGTVCGDCQCL